MDDYNADVLKNESPRYCPYKKPKPKQPDSSPNLQTPSMSDDENTINVNVMPHEGAATSMQNEHMDVDENSDLAHATMDVSANVSGATGDNSVDVYNLTVDAIQWDDTVIGAMDKNLVEKIAEQEIKFINDQEAVPYSEYKYGQAIGTVIHSRIFNQSFIWPYKLPLTANMLKSYFSSTGHTLAVANNYNYGRLLCFDIDCRCRIKDSAKIEHTQIQTIIKLIDSIRDLCKKLLQIKGKDVNNMVCQIWKRNCSYHVYFGVFVSLPTHLMLLEHVRAALFPVSKSNAQVEIVEFMPFPYSYKKTSSQINKGLPNKTIYEPVNINDGLMQMPFTLSMCSPQYFDTFSIDIVKTDFIITLITKNGTRYVNKNRTVSMSDNVPIKYSVSEIKFEAPYEYMKDAFESYVSEFVNPSLQQDITDIPDIIYDESVIEQSTKARIESFMVTICKIFNAVTYNNLEQNARIKTGYSLFIDMAACAYGGFYMQHFVAALFFYLRIEANDRPLFKMILSSIFASQINASSAVAVFIENIHDGFFKDSYHNTCDEILHHLNYLISNDVDPTVPFTVQLNTIMEKMCLMTMDDAHKLYETKKKDEKEKHIDNLLKIMGSIFLELQFFFYDRQNGRYYARHPETGVYYLSIAKITELNFPRLVPDWIRHDGIATAQLKLFIERQRELYLMEGKPIFKSLKYLLATKVGVFNSCAGLYTASTRFQHFIKYRNSVLWDQSMPTMHCGQNATLLEMRKTASRYADLLLGPELTKLFFHAVVLPALFSLHAVPCFPEVILTLFFQIMFTHTDWSELTCVVEYYQLDPKLIFLCSILMQYNELTEDGCFSYEKITKKLFDGKKQVDADDWREKYLPVLNTVTYTVDKTSHMNTLMTLKSDTDEYRSFCFKPQVCIFNTILMILYTKTPTFKPLMKAFGASDLPPVNVVPPEYENFSTVVSHATMKQNFERAKLIVCGSNLPTFDVQILDECLSLCMSAFFQPETLKSMLQSLSLSVFPMNMEKKLIIFHGYGDVGKSYICEKISQMLSPLVVSFSNMRSVIDQVSVSDQSGVILTELKQVEARDLKTITGNDANSTRIYYSQKFETLTIPPLMYAATNNYILFTEPSVDQATINRLHAITLTGCQTNPKSQTQLQTSFFDMLVKRTFYKNIFNATLEGSASALSWLSFATYLKFRNDDLTPDLEVYTVDSNMYRHGVQYQNCKVYRFLNMCGIQSRPNFFISRSIFKKIVRANCNKDSKLFQSDMQFFNEFDKLGSDKFKTDTYIFDYQTTAAIDFIAKQMDVQEIEGGHITLKQLHERIGSLTSLDLQMSAEYYFNSINTPRYDAKTNTYKGITFTSERADEYDGHITDDEIYEYEMVQPHANIMSRGVTYNTNTLLSTAGITN